MVKLEELLGAGALAILAKKLIEGSTTTNLIPKKPTRMLGFSTSQEFEQAINKWAGVKPSQQVSGGYKVSQKLVRGGEGPRVWDPKQILSLWQAGPITEITQAVDIQPYVGPSTFKFGTKIDNSGKLAL